MSPSRACLLAQPARRPLAMQGRPRSAGLPNSGRVATSGGHRRPAEQADVSRLRRRAVSMQSRDYAEGPERRLACAFSPTQIRVCRGFAVFLSGSFRKFSGQGLPPQGVLGSWRLFGARYAAVSPQCRCAIRLGLDQGEHWTSLSCHCATIGGGALGCTVADMNAVGDAVALAVAEPRRHRRCWSAAPSSPRYLLETGHAGFSARSWR